MTAETWEALKHETEETFDACGYATIYFGTNEEIEVYSYDDWIKNITVIDLPPHIAAAEIIAQYVFGNDITMPEHDGAMFHGIGYNYFTPFD